MDYRTSFSLKGKRLFYKKINDYLTKARKKTLRLLLCDYQRTARYYTIYRTFKEWSSDDFATISRLFYWRNYDYWLRLFQKLLRLFQPGRYDYCSSLLAIGRKPEKRYGGSRQWFRAAPPRSCYWTAPPGLLGLRCAAPSGVDP